MSHTHAGTKFIRLKITSNDRFRFGEWKVCWLGGWNRHRLFYLVMLVRVTKPQNESCARQ